MFCCVCYILNDREHLGKFDDKSERGIFVGYYLNSHALRVYNPQIKTIPESVNVKFDDSLSFAQSQVHTGFEMLNTKQTAPQDDSVSETVDTIVRPVPQMTVIMNRQKQMNQ